MWINNEKFMATNYIGYNELSSKPESAKCQLFKISAHYLDSFARAKHSKQALSMKEIKRRIWFKDILNESETIRMRDICTKLALLKKIIT